MEEKENEIIGLKDDIDHLEAQIQYHESEEEKLKKQKLELREKIKEYEKQIGESNQFKDSLIELLKNKNVI